MTVEAELKEIRSMLVELTKKVDLMSELLEARLIGCEQPYEDEVRATREHEAAKKKGTLKLMPVDSLNEFLEKEPDLYSVKDIKAKAKRK